MSGTETRCPTCSGDGSETWPLDANCPSAWAHGHLKRPPAPSVVPAGEAPTPEHYGPLVDVPYTGEQEAHYLRLYREREPRGRHKATLLALADEAIRSRALASSSSAIREAAERFLDAWSESSVEGPRVYRAVADLRAALSSSGASPTGAPTHDPL